MSLSRLDEISQELGQLKDKFGEIATSISKLMEERAQLWASSIFREDVQLGASPYTPSFSHVRELLEWMKKNSDKAYYEWNGRVFSKENPTEPLCTYEELKWKECPKEKRRAAKNAL